MLYALMMTWRIMFYDDEYAWKPMWKKHYKEKPESTWKEQSFLYQRKQVTGGLCSMGDYTHN